MTASAYFEQALNVIKAVAGTQGAVIKSAAEMIVAGIVAKKSIFSFGASHSFILTEEMVYRSGGLMLINPIYPHGMNFSVHPLPATSRMERVLGLGRELLDSSPARTGDILLITSNSGRNHVVIDMALRAREVGIKTVAITSLAYSRAVSSRHPGGKKLCDLCDIVIDNCTPCGDAAVQVPGVAQKVGPLSTVAGCAIVNALVAEIVAIMAAKGLTPPVFLSANLDGGDEHNAKCMAENRYRIFYM